MPFISVVVPTMRVGGIDVLIDSLGRQDFRDFELVLSDSLRMYRAEAVVTLARDRFVRLVHVEPEPNRFPLAAFCASANAGLRAATGEIILFLVDYTRAPPNLVGAHARFHRSQANVRRGLMMPHRYVAIDVDPNFGARSGWNAAGYADAVRTSALEQFMLSIGRATDRPSEPWTVHGGARATHDADPKLRESDGSIAPAFFHAKNESVRRELVIEAGGWDEAMDGAHCYQDTEFAERLSARCGVEWTLSHEAIVEIANPRGVFPLARQDRGHEDNARLLEQRRADAYPLPVITVNISSAPSPDRWALKTLTGVSVEAPLPAVSARPLRVMMIYGEFSSAIHGPFDIAGLYTRAGLTGSESSFFNLARTLAERGHEVAVFCDVPSPAEHESGFTAFPISALDRLPAMEGVDAVLAWNEPDYLQFAPRGALRVCDQQLNDFGYAGSPWYPQAGKWLGARVRRDWASLVDVWVSPSSDHRNNVMARELPGVKDARVEVIPNSVDLDLFDGPAPSRDPHRVVWCSSPDRGLHHLLAAWPLVRARIPDANLRVFYRLAPWIARARDAPDEVGRRARFIEAALPRLVALGVTVVDLVPNAQMAAELRSAAVLAYPCDPVRYTEGFGCSVLDAAAGGCLPVISGADALPSVHGSASIVVPAPPHDHVAWADAIVTALSTPSDGVMAAAMLSHAQRHDRDAVANSWVALLEGPR